MTFEKVIIGAPLKTVNAGPVLPPSKSLLIRLRLLEYLSSGKITTDAHSDAEDVLLMKNLLWWIKHCSSSRIPMVVDVGNSGAVGRFLLAALSAMPGKWFVTGDKRMKQRPVGPLVDALLELNADLSYSGRKGFLPVMIHGKELLKGMATLKSKESSQYLSALLMSLSFGKEECLIQTTKELIGDHYVRMTISILKQAGIVADIGDECVKIRATNCKVVNIPVEADWSSASFWFEVAALSPGSQIALEGLNRESLQADAVLPEIYEELGVRALFKNETLLLENTGNHTDHFEYDMQRNPDLVMPVVATCAGLGIGCKFKGVSRLRLKESDRLSALAQTFQSAGLHIKVENDDVFILEKGKFRPVGVIVTFDDHRMAMSLAPLALISGKIELGNPDVVRKSYPAFWEELKNAGFEIMFK
ncbi:MAG: hypothetical protein K9G67_03475 [Bacteroidales bacterium]|nr:hypothetical protein [Bacteroidales bacterium]MCF8344180.1 hypothetical protein [Bacteroidales bacterium]MCF8350820.1 hypothetical protein [Bacteroidales bacterium]MCF8375391.1 hypothetical protein [Bacteroidales bacterium]MCF8401270.1 hypothetical protein [Bacteroidales bacterium]